MLSVVDLGIVHRRRGRRPRRHDPGRDPADVRRLPGARADQGGHRGSACRVRPAGRGRRPPSRCPGHPSGSALPDVAPCWRPGSRRRPARSRTRRCHAHRPRAARPVPPLRLAPDHPRERLRSDPVPDHPLLRRLPPAVRSDQAGLTVAVPRVEPVELIGVVGTGTMGAGIAQLALEAGHEVLIHDVDPAAIERGRGRIRAGLERRARRLDLDPDTRRGVGRRPPARALRAAATLDVLTDADPGLVIEAVLEDLAAKRAILRALDAATWAEAILATNTSALSVEAIARATVQPARVLGLHFFNPAPVMPLVEVVVAPSTDPAVAERATAADGRLGEGDRPLRGHAGLHRQPGQPAVHARGAGDARGRGRQRRVDRRGGPRGRLSRWDRSSSWTSSGSTSTWLPRWGSSRAPDLPATRWPSGSAHRRSRSAWSPPAGSAGRRARASTATGPTGRRSGRPRGSHRVRRLLPATSEPASPPPDPSSSPASAIAERITLAIVNEAYRALGEGVATVADIDLALRLGAGHPMGRSSGRADELGRTLRGASWRRCDGMQPDGRPASNRHRPSSRMDRTVPGSRSRPTCQG